MSAGQSIQGKAYLPNGPQRRITATRASLAASLSTTALTKCSVLVSSYSTKTQGLTYCSTDGHRSDIRWVDLSLRKHRSQSITDPQARVCGRRCFVPLAKISTRKETQRLCIEFAAYHAATPLSGSDALVGSRMTPSVLVLRNGRLAEIRGVVSM